MNTNIVIQVLHLFQISHKFGEEIYHLMTVLQKSRKKKITIPIIPIIKDKEELYAKIDYLEKNAVNTYHTLIQTPRQKMTKIL